MADAEAKFENEGKGRMFALRIVVRVDDDAAFVERYHRLVRDDRIFILTKVSQPIGTALRFAMVRPDGTALLRAQGKVVRVREESGSRERPPGLVVKFIALDEESRRVVKAMADRRLRGSLPDPAIEPLDTQDAAPRSPKVGAARAPAAKRSKSEDITGSFPVGQLAPQVAETWDGPAQPPPGLPAANPLSEISDRAIDFFVEWRMDRSMVEEATHVDPPPFVPLPPTVMAAPAVPVEDFSAEATVEESPPSPRSPEMPPPLPPIAAAPPPALSAILATESPVSAAATPPSPGAPSDGGLRRWRMAAVIGPIAGLALGVPIGAYLLGSRGAVPAPAPAAMRAVAAPVEEKVVPTPNDPPSTPAEVPKADPPKANPPPPKPAPPAKTNAAPARVEAKEEAPPARPGRKMATLAIVSTPVGAEVRVNGEPRGRTPASIELPAGHRYDVEVALDGHPTWRRRVNVKPPETALKISLGK